VLIRGGVSSRGGPVRSLAIHAGRARDAVEPWATSAIVRDNCDVNVSCFIRSIKAFALGNPELIALILGM
jgi:hypothetical protein